MTVKELIEELKNVPEDTKIVFTMDDGCCGDFFQLEFSSCDTDKVSLPKEEPYYKCEIRLKAMEGFTSCIKSGRTKEFIKSLDLKK